MRHAQKQVGPSIIIKICGDHIFDIFTRVANFTRQGKLYFVEKESVTIVQKYSIMEIITWII